MSSSTEICSAFIEAVPPGELNEVVNDVKALTSDDDPALIQKLKPAFQKYNEDQLLAVKLPGGSQHVLISAHNRLDASSSTYYDTATSTSFTFDHITQKASSPQSYTHESPHSDLIASISRSISSHFQEHYPASTSSTSSASTVCASAAASGSIAILLSTLKASPQNFLSGRWRSSFLYSRSTGTLRGVIKVDVHYYEDGNVALKTQKTIPETQVGSGDGATGDEIVRKVAALEKQYQEEVNRGVVGMNEGMFKGLRRQLPVTRQRVEWEKVRGYGLGGDLRGDR
ncbi:F-actin-capping protein subunit alpha [Cyphellophora attinorum]|uniref:F-actin-capping protein subunit alpha n=1 Tax=Cyphellophora attinorum TaxID=1664694 RepID=A0A0N1NYY5_9EURO|nr:F-actin-capping protein subunit alpha [Phialophora attinorum]KPI39344.1 F-actin-capping protein subunit alpha [Phialophora attinorum]